MNSNKPPLDQADQTLLAGREDRDALRVIMAMDRRSRPVVTAQFLCTFLPPQSRVRIVTVAAYQEQPDSPWGRMVDSAEAAAQMAAVNSKDFYSARQLLQMTGASVSFGHRYGHAADEVLTEASDWCADLIVVGHDGNSSQRFLGSVTEAIVKRSRLPVLVVPELRVPTEQMPETAVGEQTYSLSARLAR